MSGSSNHENTNKQLDGRMSDSPETQRDDRGDEQHHGQSGSGEHAEHEGGHQAHHEHMLKDFRRRFWVSLVLTVPILALSKMIQGWVGLEQTLSFPGDQYVQFALATAVFFYGGWPFLKGLFDELKRFEPGMMTLIGLAIITAYVYSSLVVFGLQGRVFFWELATLIDVMLLGHWIEMRMSVSRSRLAPMWRWKPLTSCWSIPIRATSCTSCRYRRILTAR